MKSKLFEDDKGNLSAMRIIAVPGGFTGMLISALGALGMLLDKDAAGAGLAAGAGMFTAAVGLKALQRHFENGTKPK